MPKHVSLLRSPARHAATRAATTFLLAYALGCGEGAAPEHGSRPLPAVEHLIPLEQGQAMLERQAVSQQPADKARLEPASPAPVTFDVQYALGSFREVLQQQGAIRVIVALGENEGGATTLVVGALDASGAWLPLALAAGQAVAASEAMEWTHGLSDTAQAVVRKIGASRDEPVVRSWTYDVVAIRKFAQQGGIESVRVALGQTPEGSSTAVMLGLGAAAYRAPVAGDRGTPCPPYCA